MVCRKTKQLQEESRTVGGYRGYCGTCRYGYLIRSQYAGVKYRHEIIDDWGIWQSTRYPPWRGYRKICINILSSPRRMWWRGRCGCCSSTPDIVKWLISAVSGIGNCFSYVHNYNKLLNNLIIWLEVSIEGNNHVLDLWVSAISINIWYGLDIYVLSSLGCRRPNIVPFW